MLEDAPLVQGGMGMTRVYTTSRSQLVQHAVVKQAPGCCSRSSFVTECVTWNEMEIVIHVLSYMRVMDVLVSGAF